MGFKWFSSDDDDMRMPTADEIAAKLHARIRTDTSAKIKSDREKRSIYRFRATKCFHASGGISILWAKYDNCKTNDGNKILLIKNASHIKEGHQYFIDPHFREDNRIVARFAPNKDGLKMAFKALEVY